MVKMKLKTIVASFRLLTRSNKTKLVVLIVLRIFSNFLDILAIVAIGAVVSVGLGENPAFDLPWNSSTYFVPLGIAGACLVLLAKALLGLRLAKSTFLLLSEIESEQSERIARALFGSSLMEMEEKTKEELEWAILRSPTYAFSSTLGNATTLVVESSLALLVMAIFFIADWSLALGVTLYFGAILALFTLISDSVLREAGSRFSLASQKVSEQVANLSTALREHRVYGSSELFLSELNRHRAEVSKAHGMSIYLSFVPRLVVELGLVFGALGLLALQLGLGAEPHYPTLAVFLLGSLRVMTALLPIQRSFMALTYEGPLAQAALETVENFNSNRPDSLVLEKPPEIQIEPVANSGVQVCLTGVNFSYPGGPKDAKALNDISFCIEAGSHTAIIGRSGAGKSTLADMVLGLLQPTTGQVTLDGLTPEEFIPLNPGNLGYVPQRPGIVSGSIRENIAIGITEEAFDEGAFNRATKLAELDPLLESLPNGADTPMNQIVGNLSGGEVQRIGLARSLYFWPRILVLDEATSALDAETEDSITTNLLSLGGRITVMTIAHRLSTIQAADEVILLEDGRIVTRGKFHELIQRNQAVKRFVELMTIG